MNMRKRILALLLLLSLVLALTACAQGNQPGTVTTTETPKAPGTTATETTAPTTEATETTAVSESTTPTETENQGERDPYLEKYAPVLDRYTKALQEQWYEGKLREEGMSVLLLYCYDGNPLENVGYSLLDLNGDTIPELLIGATGGDAYVQDLLFEVYTLQNDTPLQLLTGGDRSNYRLCDDESGCYFLENQASASAEQREWLYFILTGDQLSVIQGIAYDATSDPEKPWYMTYDTDWDTSNDTAIDEDTARAIIAGYDDQCVTPVYTPFSAQ